jgi:hypothetical protein
MQLWIMGLEPEQQKCQLFVSVLQASTKQVPAGVKYVI